MVEDESVIREGFRDNIPWEQNGFEFVGDAADGEMALPLIRKYKPDILITDIKMPFMDGLALSRIVSQEFPGIKIIIISGYDDFEYAREAISVGVEQYLLKPITRNALLKTLREVGEKIETEREQKSYLEKFQLEVHEYEQYSRHTFLEQLFCGQLSASQIYEEAGKLNFELNGPYFNLLFVNIEIQKEEQYQYTDNSVKMELLHEEMMRYFYRFPEFFPFRWNISMYGILLQGQLEQMEEYANRCVNYIRKVCTESDVSLKYHIAISNPVERSSMLAECYERAMHIHAFRFLSPGKEVLTSDDIVKTEDNLEKSTIDSLDPAQIDSSIIQGFLMNGQESEVDDFVTGYLGGLQDAMQSNLFRDYLLLNIRFTTQKYIEALGITKEEFLTQLEKEQIKETAIKAEEVEQYMRSMLSIALQYGKRENDNQTKRVLKKVTDYLEENYCKESLSLNEVASVIGVSPSYLSGIFSQEMEQTFVEYVSMKRIEKSKILLKQNELSTAEIAASVGYKDSHYFSFVFKKLQGCTPREYRAKGAS